MTNKDEIELEIQEVKVEEPALPEEDGLQDLHHRPEPQRQRDVRVGWSP